MSALLEAVDLSRHYQVRAGRGPLAGKAILRAVDGVSLRIDAGRTLGLVGESGCGKSTTGKLVLGLITPSSGTVHYAGTAMPPTAATSGRIRSAGRASWPTSISRLISSPTSRKNRLISPSLIQCSSESGPRCRCRLWA